MKKLIDLSQEIYTGMPVYPGHLETVIWERLDHERSKEIYPDITWSVWGLLMCDHGPTHVDSPYHLDPRGKSIDKLSLELFYTDAICLDVSHVRYPKLITEKDLQESLKKSNLSLKKGDTVLLYTGHYNRAYPKREWLTTYTGLSKEAMEWLADKGVINVGVDAPSIDSSDATQSLSWPAHKVCKERGVLNTENLANLDKIVGKRFTFIGFPLKIRGASGSPIRAVALFDE